MTDSIDERLDKLIRDFDELLGNHRHIDSGKDIDNMDRLHDLGLTIDEAKVWLEQEPNYRPSDDWKHGRKSDDKVPVPARTRFISGDVNAGISV
jgi:hypothetical protein